MNNDLKIAAYGFLTVCMLAICIFNLDLIKSEPLRFITPLIIAIIALVLFLRKLEL